jgi:hypothetical protein
MFVELLREQKQSRRILQEAVPSFILEATTIKPTEESEIGF